MKRLMTVLIAAMALCISTVIGFAQDRGVSSKDWALYKARFLAPNGRIIDNANNNISHSEGQGYGLLLAYLANEPADFERIWSFTQSELMVRNDGLAAWRWDPAAHPHVTDINNATDGDLLIAYALALAGFSWQSEAYMDAATRIAKTLLERTVIEHGKQSLLLPGVEGFSAKDRKDGPVVNLSYWVFEALPVMNALAPSDKWESVYTSGLQLLETAQFGPRKLPSDWISLGGEEPVPAAGFEPQFGYNSIRIPLYLIRAEIKAPKLLERIKKGMTFQDHVPALVNVETGIQLQHLKDPGYQIINHIMACSNKDNTNPAVSRDFNPKFYYPSTLQLLGLAYVKEKRSECLVSRSSSSPR